MSFLDTVKEKAAAFLATAKGKIAVASVSVVSMVQYASAAFDINGTIGPIVEGITALIPTLGLLVLAMIPLAIYIAIAKFFPQLFDNILGALRF